MDRKTAKSSVRKNAKAEKPYGTAKRTPKRTSKPSTAPLPLSVPSSSSSSRLPGPPSTEFRKTCLDKIRERYPGLKPRSDWDILQLASTETRPGTHAEIFAGLDKELAEDIEAFGDEINDNVKTLLDTYMEPTGIKPPPGTSNDLIFIRPIPDSQYSIRLFPGSYSNREYCLDFLDTETGKPVNSPFEYELWAIPDPDAPWLSLPMSGKLHSIERTHGIKQGDILPGCEKFILRDGQTCMLARPGRQPVRFTVPLRRYGPEVEAESMVVLDLPRVVRL
ncbi:hypothetical protein C8Q79DRAFT_1012831 [Trametes meyenii]|nr:hypothetical protein C8Q79DRAFT_1012831 [Trametes meyenii]